MLLEERHELSEFVAGATAEEWATPSLCGEWTVGEVAAHLSSVVGLTRRGLVARNLRYGAGTDGANARTVAAWSALGQPAIAESLAEPGKLGLGFFYPRWALGEMMVHHQDMRRPTGRSRPIPDERLRVALGVLLRLPFLTGADRKSRRVALRATDIDWAHGSGPAVEGPAESILMALAGRSGLAGELSGDGVAVLLGGERS